MEIEQIIERIVNNQLFIAVAGSIIGGIVLYYFFDRKKGVNKNSLSTELKEAKIQVDDRRSKKSES